MSMLFISPPFGNYVRLPGCISIKGSFTLRARSGLLRQIGRTLRYIPKYKGWVNCIGLKNKGIDWAVRDWHLGCSSSASAFIYSIAIPQCNEIPQLLEKIPDSMNIELNISCPNVKKDSLDALASYSLSQFLHPNRHWCIVKLSPLTTLSQIDHYYAMGFRQFHCCNTLPVPEGGLSGIAIQKYNRPMIQYIREKYPECIVIAGGGIIDPQSAALFLREEGANHISVSTLCFTPWKLFHLWMWMQQKEK